MIEYVAVAAATVSLAASAYLAVRVARLESRLNLLFSAASRSERLARSLARLKAKPRKRYIVFEVVSAERIAGDDVERAVSEAVRRLFGVVGEIDSWIRLVEYDEESRRGILRVRNTYKYHALAVLGTIRRIGGVRVMIVPLSTHGTIKSARKRMQRR